MSIPTFQERAKMLAKPGDAIVAGLTVETLNDLQSAIALVVDAGLLLDKVKKCAIHGKSTADLINPLDRQALANVAEGLTPVDSAALATITGGRAELLHAAVGIAGEAAELLEQVANCVFYEQELDGDNVMEELGDLKFFVGLTQNVCGMTDEQINSHNHHKLKARYPAGSYSDAAAQARADKQ